jgi:hypothetical protein
MVLVGKIQNDKDNLEDLDLDGKILLTLSDPMSDLVRHYDFPVPDAFPHVVRTLANRLRSRTLFVSVYVFLF